VNPETIAVTATLLERGPAVATIVVAKLPGLEPVKVHVEIAEMPRTRLVGLHETLTPGPVADSARVPVNPLMPVAVTFTLAELPGLNVTLLALAVKPKSEKLILSTNVDQHESPKASHEPDVVV